MKSATHPHAQPEVNIAPDGDVLRHLADSLRKQGRRYRKRLQRCQRRFSEEAVHDTRVEARRLLATIALLGAFFRERKLQKVRDALKHHLDTFDPLRDTQVQLVYVGGLTRVFPAARAFREWLLKREARFAREARQNLQRLKSKRLARGLAALEAKLRRRRKRTPRELAATTVQHATAGAFARVARLSRRVATADTATIHRTRIAFKRFRYMVEALSPLLPDFSEQQRRALRGFQSMMGDIQDAEMLLAAFDKYLRKQEIHTAEAKRLRQELRRRRQWLIQVYLHAAGKLRQFWPPPDHAPSARKPKRSK